MITTRQQGAIRYIKFDDGKVNVITLSAAEALKDAITDAEADKETSCLIIEGNERALTVGLDTKTVLENDADAHALLNSMGAVLKTLYLSRLRSIVITQGHATAAGAMLLLVADHRIGCGRGGKIGLSEVRVGLSVPLATQQLVKDRIVPGLQYASTALARLFDYPAAERAGYLDATCETYADALESAEIRAAEFAALNEDAYLKTKQSMRRAYTEIVEGR
jgi:enoyl-CoA hydratase